MPKTPPPPDSIPRVWRKAVVGPGPHVVKHDLGLQPVVLILDDHYANLHARIEFTDPNSLTFEVGYFSIPAGDWIQGCSNNAIVHVMVTA